MNRQERLIAGIVLGLIAIGAVAIHFGKPRMGNPGLAMEKATLTNELGKIVRTERVRFPNRALEFRSFDGAITDNEVTNLPPDTVFGRKIYLDGTGFAAQMSAVMMQMDRTSIHRPELCVTGQGWKIAKKEVIDIPVALPGPYVLKATCLTSTRQNPADNKIYAGIYVYWFVSEPRTVAGHGQALWAISEDLLTAGTLYPWGYVSCFARCQPGQEGLYLSRMKRLISTTAPGIPIDAATERETNGFPSQRGAAKLIP